MVEWVGEREGEGGVRVYEASEVKKGGAGNFWCLLLRRKKNFISIYIYEVFTWEIFQKRSTIHYSLLPNYMKLDNARLHVTVLTSPPLCLPLHFRQGWGASVLSASHPLI